MSNTSPITLLLVDDEKHIRLSLGDHLSHEGFNVTTAINGEDALEKLKEMSPDLIILDISMPGMGGTGFLRHISREDGSTIYPVLVLTARSSMKEFFESIHVDGFMGKPCREAELVSMIREITDHHRQAGAKQTRKRKQILLAEDQETIAQSIISSLQDAGFEVSLVTNGPDVLEQCVTVKPDLFLLKEVLFGLNGSAIASMLQVMPSARTTPIIVFDQTRSDQLPPPNVVDSIQNLKAFVCSANPGQLTRAVKKALLS
jgi:DNA-binding response OmpR family regulator